MIQVGARNMQNYSLLRLVGKTRKAGPPQSGMAGRSRTPHGRRIRAGRGNYQVVLCERGIRTFADTRATPSTSRVGRSKRLSHLPIIVESLAGTGSATR